MAEKLSTSFTALTSWGNSRYSMCVEGVCKRTSTGVQRCGCSHVEQDRHRCKSSTKPQSLVARPRRGKDWRGCDATPGYLRLGIDALGDELPSGQGGGRGRFERG